MKVALLGALVAALIYAAVATAAEPRMMYSSAPSYGCHSGGHTYTLRDTAVGNSGFVSGIPANDISYTVQISPMSGGLTSTNDFNAMFFSVGRNAVQAQAGTNLGAARLNGWNSGGYQYTSSWHNYVELIDNTAQPPYNYYYMDLGATGSTVTVTFTQLHTNGAFYVYVNGVLSLYTYLSSGSGRQSEMATENYNGDNATCDNMDGYFYQPTINPNYSGAGEQQAFTACWNSRDWEGWNRNYRSGWLHGPVGNPGIWTCLP